MKYISIIIASIFLSSLSFSQEVGMSYSKLWSGHYEIENPNGFGIFISKSISRVGLKLEYTNHRNEREYYGYIISGFMQHPTEKQEELVKSYSQIHSIDLSVNYPLLKIKNINFGIGAGIGQNIMSGKREGTQTGKTSNLFDSTKLGMFLEATITLEKMKHIPISFYIAGKFKNIIASQAPTDIESPFSNEINSSSLQFGLSYKLK